MAIREKWSFWIKEKIFLFRELSYLIDWWLSIVVAINTIKNNSENMAVKLICENIYDSLIKWESLFRSMTKLNKFFNDWDINIIRSWESSWELQNVLWYLANEYEYLYDIRNKYIWAMLYPVIVFWLSIAAVFIILKYVLPSITTMITQFDNVEIPFTTKVLISLTDIVSNFSRQILVVIWIIVFWISIILTVEEWKKYFEYQIIKIPVFWKINRYYYLVKFLRYFRLLLRAWLSYVDVFNLLKQIMWNNIYKDMIDDIIVDIRKWSSFTNVLETYRIIIPANVVSILRAWEETASLPKSIENALWFYEQEFNKIMDNLSKIIEPLLIIFVGFVVWFIALSVFGIIWTILDSMQI